MHPSAVPAQPHLARRAYLLTYHNVTSQPSRPQASTQTLLIGSVSGPQIPSSCANRFRYWGAIAGKWLVSLNVDHCAETAEPTDSCRLSIIGLRWGDTGSKLAILHKVGWGLERWPRIFDLLLVEPLLSRMNFS